MSKSLKDMSIEELERENQRLGVEADRIRAERKVIADEHRHRIHTMPRPAVRGAAFCQTGHANPGGALYCNTCGAEIFRDADAVAEPFPSTRAKPAS